MNRDLLQTIIQKSKELMDSPTCSAETKDAVNDWLNAVNTDNEQSATSAYIKALERDIMPIDNLIAFSSSPEGANYFGEETAASIAAHAKKIKAEGAKFCDCPACTLVAEILEHKKEMLG